MIELGVLTGVEESGIDIANVSLYPLPAEDIVNVSLESLNGGINNVLIMDVQGKIVYEEQVTLQKGMNRIEMNIDQLNAGNYFLMLQNNSTSPAVKLIKQ